ncbi:Serine/arginine repetitive matrix protein 2 [Leucosporidium creatinivorum]|uniref:Serine/arginine repetitive matrix protein 2 n=1 Tax=Leucosporidium creatinivorum TaxID=106004 RepID=A0A1Y2FXA7_9BASI|nr:Serine/arginine repetitive matrix protein 2 [Leucosporidium creatinivorum]
MPPRAVPRSPSPDTSADDIPPLAFDTEEELLAVFARLREDLLRRVGAKWEADGMGGAKGKGMGVDRKKVEDIVLKQFFDKMGPIVLSNCTIAGVPYSKYKDLKKSGSNVQTQPFSEDLHQRVLTYQNELFDAREENIRKRVEEPELAAGAVAEIISADRERLEQLEAAKVVFPEEHEREEPAPRGRKSVGGTKLDDGPSPEEAQEDFAKGKRAIDTLLKEVPKLSTAAEGATKVAVDAARVE